MSEFVVRRASAQDVDALAELITQLGYPTTGISMRHRLAALAERPDYVTFVACGDEQVVAAGGAFLHLTIEHDAPAARLTGVVVHERWRGRGIGAVLVRRLEEWARERKAFAVTLTSADRRGEAHKFYRHIGYQQTGVRFTKLLT